MFTMDLSSLGALDFWVSQQQSQIQCLSEKSLLSQSGREQLFILFHGGTMINKDTTSKGRKLWSQVELMLFSRFILWL